MTAYALSLAGESVLLLPQKALYWPRRKTLLVADIHFGKASAFRAQGVPVPSGTTSANLAALDELLALHPVERIVFLGDFLHARAAHAPATLAAMLAWRGRHRTLALTLVRGNHDRHAGDPSALLGIEMVDEPWQLGPFSLCHHPDLAAPGYVLAGHVHPVFRLAAGRDALRLPCFLVGAARAVLPSFGAFTGGFAVAPAPGERLFLVAGEAVLALPGRG
ncbi:MULTISPECIES: ligase-associated DNA damage response endonuclease PdeM [unclassified Janthinobacterium]|uniref:ligase-associated DNA damage response endonuclease PdeM n=1 Tax=unclassified Janthinobacterium TaxID=2610881 RepID=UPI00034C4F93|nr:MULTISPECIES: ligase-associated DNA damage response endonuclease PdeM [unclassified Janthinobacterium]MEC5161431.1 DNA ligase-associated metallophosphoesterase [Janthinobacterium sp. CG_S6]